MKPSDWRGGKIAYKRTATLVSAANPLSEWASDIAVNRADLLRVFPPAEAERFQSGRAFTREDPATIAPWWSANQTLAWIACGIPSYVEHVGKLEAELFQGDARHLMAQATVEADMGACDEARAFMATRRAAWPEGEILAHAGRELLASIQRGEVKPAASENGRGRAMSWTDFAGVGSCQHGGDWLRLDPQPLFASAEVMHAFPAITLAPVGTEASILARNKPGPAADPDWPAAIEKVTADCIAAGYATPLKRGDKAAIQNLLLSAMAERNKHPSDDTARKYAEKVIEKLPDNSGDQLSAS